jgi:4-hydroxybenzoate polyprenyltransferase
MKVAGLLKEYFRLGRIFNAEIISLIMILSYLLTSFRYGLSYDIRFVIILFIAGVCAHFGGSINNDRMDLSIDKTAEYCSHKPLVTGKIRLNQAKWVEYTIMSLFAVLVMIVSILSSSNASFFPPIPRQLFTLGYIIGAIFLAYAYNRWNKSNMFINIIGQFYAGFVVLIGMSIIVDFDYILGLLAFIIGLNGVYLNIIEADIKDIEGDIVNVPKALGVSISGGRAYNVLKFYLVNDIIKLVMFLLILYVLYLENVGFWFYVLAIILFFINYVVRILLFVNLGKDREVLKRFIAAQELTSVLLISTAFMVVSIWIPVVSVLIVIVWLSFWNKMLWNTYLRPQV